MNRIFTIVMITATLASCADNPNEPFCDTCPFFSAEISVACDPCDVTMPIEVTIENNWDKTLITSVCNWRLFGSTGQEPEEIQRLDCSSVFPEPLEIGPQSSAVLKVEVEAASLPDLMPYAHFRIGLDLEWRDVADPKPFELLTGPFAIPE